MVARYSVAAALVAAAAFAAPPHDAAPRSTSGAGHDVIKALHRVSVAVAPGTARAGQVIVALRDGTDARDGERALRAEGGVREIRRGRSGRRVLVTLEPDASVADAIAAFSRLPEVAYAEPNGVVRKSEAQTFKPNDRYYKYQWNLVQMNAERTWGIQKGKSAVAVAVLDTGVAFEDYTDPVTRQSFRKAPDWGDTVFLPGHDFVNGDDHPNDDDGHGTHVASTIAEATNNDIGMAGLAFQCAILPVKVLDQHGEGAFFDVAEGIDYAVEYTQNGQNPVKVINLSLGSESDSQTLELAIDRAFNKGVTTVAAAGNSGKSTVEFPARAQRAIAVGALDERKERAPYSNTGSNLEFVAPGGNCDRDDDADGVADCIFQQTIDPDALDQGRFDQFCYCGLDGTSMASPHVAAAAALLYSQGFTDAAAVRAALEQTAERLGGASGRNDTFGYGLVRPANALPGLGVDTGPTK
jgi:serine protease